MPRLAKIPAEQRMELPGITPERTHQIVAGAMGMKTRFVVQQPPHEEAGVWTMTVDGVRVTRE